MNGKAISGVILCCIAISALFTGCSDKNSGSAEQDNMTSMSPASETVSLKDIIDISSAESAALAHAGLTDAETKFTKTELDYESGSAEYEIEFIANGYKYEYDINAVDGSVLKSSKEEISGTDTDRSAADEIPAVTSKPVETTAKETTAKPAETTRATTTTTAAATRKAPSTTAAAGNITAEDAKAAALNHAGLKASEVTFTKTKLDYDDGTAEYEIEFYSASEEYEYDINAATGTVIKYSKEALTLPAINSSKDTLTAEEAKAAALAHAGLKASEVTFTKAELDYDDGKAKYEIEFNSASDKYEYDINASTGAVLKYSKEAISNQNDTDIITADEAKTAALEYAGLTDSEVKFTKAELDYDDGKAEYEIEFYYGRKEYEMKIDAYSGKIIEAETD